MQRNQPHIIRNQTPNVLMVYTVVVCYQLRYQWIPTTSLIDLTRFSSFPLYVIAQLAATSAVARIW